MKLFECEIGKVVVNKEGEIGHIVGFTYRYDMMHSDGSVRCPKFRSENTIPLVQFPSDKFPIGISEQNIELATRWNSR